MAKVFPYFFRCYFNICQICSMSSSGLKCLHRKLVGSNSTIVIVHNCSIAMIRVNLYLKHIYFTVLIWGLAINSFYIISCHLAVSLIVFLYAKSRKLHIWALTTALTCFSGTFGLNCLVLHVAQKCLFVPLTVCLSI